jgi:hypothetical protein
MPCNASKEPYLALVAIIISIEKTIATIDYIG